MSRTMKSLGNYQGRQSDDDFQRHNANRHHREGSGQDRYGQQGVRGDIGAPLYTVENQKTQGDGRYYRLRSAGSYGSRDGQWVKAKEVRHVDTTIGGEKLFLLV